MKIEAIVYTSRTGFTRQYARMLGEKTSLPVYSLEEAVLKLPGGSSVIYLGWVYASHVKGFARAAKHFTIRAVCGVGLCDTGTMTREVREATSIPAEIPLFTLQGGFDSSKLKGFNKLMISMLKKGLASKTQPTEQEKRMLQLISKDANYVSEDHLREILKRYWMNETPQDGGDEMNEEEAAEIVSTMTITGIL